MTAFNGLEGMKLTSLNLDGNPICKKMDAYSYVTELKNIFPNLQNIVSCIIKQTYSLKDNLLIYTNKF